MDSLVEISIVVPLFNEEESLAELHAKISEVMAGLGKSYEICFVDDGSTDKSFEVLENLHRNDPHVSVFQFEKNFGKSIALAYGFHMVKGEYVITMDADLQDDPAEIPKLIEKIDEGFDLVSGWKKKRNDPLNKTLPSRFFNAVTRWTTGIRIHDFNCGLKIYRKKVVKKLRLYGELHRYIPVLAHFVGYKVGEIVVKHHPRKFGKTKFGLSRFLNGFFDLFTVLFLSKYVSRPLHLFGLLGLFFFLIGVSIHLYLTVLWFMGTGIGGRPLFFLGILLTILGIQFGSIGLLGEMIANYQRKQEELFFIKRELK